MDNRKGTKLEHERKKSKNLVYFKIMYNLINLFHHFNLVTSE